MTLPMWLFHRCCLSCRAKLYWDPEHTNASSNGANQLSQQQRNTAQIIPLRSALLSTNVSYFPETFPSLSCQKPTPSPVSIPTSVFSGLCSGICSKFPHCTSLLLSKLIHFNFYVRSSPPTLENEKGKKEDKEDKEREWRWRKEGRRGQKEGRGKEKGEEGRMARSEGERRGRRSCTLFSFSIHLLTSTRLPFCLYSSPPIDNVSLSL